MAIEVTDHALVRWLQRVHGIDMDGFRAQLAAELSGYAGVEAAAVTRSGFRYVLEDDRLVTVTRTKHHRVAAERARDLDEDDWR